MTDLPTLKSLQKRIREAKGADRELDDDIFAALFPEKSCRLVGMHEDAPDIRMFEFSHETGTSLRVTGSLDACVALLRSVLPGYAWKVGTCCVSDDAWVVPDFNCPVHGERLRAEYGEIEWGSIWDTGIDIDRRPSGNVCLALLDAIISALIAQEEAKVTT